MRTDHTSMDAGKVLAGYLVCCLWASTDENGGSMDDRFEPSDLAPEARASAEADVLSFLAYCEEEGIDVDAYPLGAEAFGHDFWLTRNRHGAGFWDRGIGALGGQLTDAAHTFGSSDAYVGDDGRVYLT